MQEQDDNPYRFPRRINAPLPVIIFPAVQIMPALMILGASMVFDFGMQGLAAAAGYFFLCGQIIKNSHITTFIHKVWSLGLLDLAVQRSKSVPNPLIKRYYS